MWQQKRCKTTNKQYESLTLWNLYFSEVCQADWKLDLWMPPATKPPMITDTAPLWLYNNMSDIKVQLVNNSHKVWITSSGMLTKLA